jgi:polyisoprenoid-binding protein YceI
MMRAFLLAIAGVAVVAAASAYAFLRPTAESSQPVAAVPIPPTADVAGASAGMTVYEIAPERSQARFVIDEVLRGQPNTVVGQTDQVSGQIALDPELPSNARIGMILINARALATDDNQRNNAIRRFILVTDEHEYITFRPTTLTGLPATANQGQPYTFQIAGELTMRGATRVATSMPPSRLSRTPSWRERRPPPSVMPTGASRYRTSRS